MKHSITSSPATRQHPHVALHEADRAHAIAQSSPQCGVTLGDIHRKLVELLEELAGRKASKKALRLPNVRELTGDGRSQIYARMNPKYAAYDASWPRPFFVNKSPRWWEHEIQAWLDARDLESRKH